MGRGIRDWQARPRQSLQWGEPPQRAVSQLMPAALEG